MTDNWLIFTGIVLTWSAALALIKAKYKSDENKPSGVADEEYRK